MIKRRPALGVSRLCLVFACLVWVSSAWAVQYYRYKDEQGKVVMALTIPPQYVAQGYEILNDKGRLVKRVAPALTQEQIAARDAEIERQRLLELERAKQAEADAQLLQLYSHPDDAVRVMNRQASEVLDVIQLERGKIEFAQKEIISLEEQAAQSQRKGLPVPEKVTVNIARLNKEIENSLVDIGERFDDFEKVIEAFDKDIKRLELVTKKRAETYDSVLQALSERKQTVK